MVTCPVCEHAQEGGVECEGCGKRFVHGGAEVAAVQPLLELERTRHAPSPAEQAPVVLLAELERTLLTSGPDRPAEVVPELQVTGFEHVAAVSPVDLPDLERHRAPAEPPTVSATPEAPGLTCRYCRHTQAEGLLCDRCGMKLSRPLGTAALVARGQAAADLQVRCRSCGAKATAGQRCGDCGQAVPLPDA